MNDQALPSPDPDAATALVAGLRAAMGLTLVEMGERVGLSKSQMHEVERTDRASLRVALAIEALSAGVPGMAINAACLCEDVNLARHGFPVTADMEQSATGQAGQLSGGPSTGSGRAGVGGAQ